MRSEIERETSAKGLSRAGVVNRAARALLAACAILAGCGKMEKAGLPTARLLIKGVELQVEVASTDVDRVRGLRFRSELPRGSGMAFLFPEDRYLRFVMDDTVVPLSIAFVAREGTIVQIEDMEPLATTRTWALEKVPYAIEVPQGWFRENGIGVGDRVEGLGDLVARSPPN